MFHLLELLSGKTLCSLSHLMAWCIMHNIKHKLCLCTAFWRESQFHSQYIHTINSFALFIVSLEYLVYGQMIQFTSC